MTSLYSYNSINYINILVWTKLTTYFLQSLNVNAHDENPKKINFLTD